MRFALELELEIELELFYLELCWSTGRAAVRERAVKARGVRVTERAAKPRCNTGWR